MNSKISFLVTIGLSVVLQVGKAQDAALASSSISESIQNSMIGQFEKEKEKVSQQLDSIKISTGGTVVFTDEDVNIAQRIQRIQKTVPLEYNARVKSYLDKYISQNYKPYMEKVLGLGQYYFPIFEQIFEEQGIPDEVKYVAVVESSLNTHEVSTSGAVGPWQFIYSTAKVYNLAMDSYYDERKDAYSTTYAVSSYLKEAYDEFNDWLLAIASYNCGRGCVRRAIQRSGLNSPSYWELSPFLPKETQNYIPKYVAMTYVMNHTDLYNLEPQQSNLLADCKILMLDKSISLDQLASNLGIDARLLKDLNPSFKRAVVTASAAKPRRLVLPYQEEMSDSVVYAALQNQATVPQVQQALAAMEKPAQKYHKVKRGETIHNIAANYGVSVRELRAWNGLSSKSSISGKNLLIAKASDNDAESMKVVSQPKAKATFVTHTVRKGDTLSDIAQKYRGATVSRIKSDNNIKGSHLKIGQKIKVYKGNS